MTQLRLVRTKTAQDLKEITWLHLRENVKQTVNMKDETTFMELISYIEMTIR